MHCATVVFAQYICIFAVFSTAIPIRTKRVLVDKHMEASRFQEEIKLLKKEMIGFMTFYKNNVLPSLANQQEQLQEFLKGIASQQASRSVGWSVSQSVSLSIACLIPIHQPSAVKVISHLIMTAST